MWVFELHKSKIFTEHAVYKNRIESEEDFSQEGKLYDKQLYKIIQIVYLKKDISGME